MSILQILGILPMLIGAVENLFRFSMPGNGTVKKDIVMGSIDAIVGGLNAVGSKIDGQQVKDVASLLIDDYVAVQNVVGAFQHSKAVDNR